MQFGEVEVQFVILVHFNCHEYGMQNLSFLCVLLFITMICIFFGSYSHVLPTITVMCRFRLFYLFYLSFFFFFFLGGGGGGGGSASSFDYSVKLFLFFTGTLCFLVSRHGSF